MNMTRNLAMVVLFLGVVAVVIGTVFIGLGVARNNELKEAMLVEHVALGIEDGEAEGQVIIQTYVPEHYAIMASTTHNYNQFYHREIKSRRALQLPPFAHLINLTLRSHKQKRVQEAADDLSIRQKRKGKGQDIQIERFTIISIKYMLEPLMIRMHTMLIQDPVEIPWSSLWILNRI